MTVAFIPGLPGGSEWIIILIIALLIFGKRLPEVMRSLGLSVKQFRKGMDEAELDTECLADEGKDNANGSLEP